jgi:hypothetical protein
MYIYFMLTLRITALNEEKNLKVLFADIDWLLSQHPNLNGVITDDGSMDNAWNPLIEFNEGMHGLEVPEDYEKFIGYQISREAADITSKY